MSYESGKASPPTIQSDCSAREAAVQVAPPAPASFPRLLSTPAKISQLSQLLSTINRLSPVLWETLAKRGIALPTCYDCR